MSSLATIKQSDHGPVRLRIVSAENATMTIEIGVDYSEAPVPNNHYDADYCAVRKTRTGIALIFGKLFSDKNALRNQIEISFSEEFFYRQLLLNTRDLHVTARRLANGNNLTPITPDSTERVQAFRATNVFMGVLTSEAVLDFYYISPGEIHMARTKQFKREVALDPVVRVVVATPLLVEFLDQCEALGKEISPNIIEEVTGK